MSIATQPSIRRLFSGFALLLAAFWLTAMPAAAQPSPLYATLEDYVRAQTQGLPGKVSFTLSPLDNRTQLPACQAFEPFLPTGGKLWGKSTVGVRCLGPSTWTIYVGVQVSVVGNYLVSARNLAGGSLLTAEDVAVRNGDLSALPSSILTDPAQAVGKTLKNGVAGGQPLRSDLMTAPWAVQQGQNVRTVSSGPGFSVTSEGRALNNAAEGQIVQVRTVSGQMVSGIARAGGIVEIAR